MNSSNATYAQVFREIVVTSTICCEMYPKVGWTRDGERDRTVHRGGHRGGHSSDHCKTPAAVLCGQTVSNRNQATDKILKNESFTIKGQS